MSVHMKTHAEVVHTSRLCHKERIDFHNRIDCHEEDSAHQIFAHHRTSDGSFRTDAAGPFDSCTCYRNEGFHSRDTRSCRHHEHPVPEACAAMAESVGFGQVVKDSAYFGHYSLAPHDRSELEAGSWRPAAAHPPH